MLNDGLFLACDSTINDSLQRRANMSSALAGNEGLFNLRLDGAGVVALETPCPLEAIVAVDLQNDELKIDGSYALARSSSLDFTVERSGKSLIGSAASGEGLVNVYRGTGRVLMAPMQPATSYTLTRRYQPTNALHVGLGCKPVSHNQRGIPCVSWRAAGRVARAAGPCRDGAEIDHATTSLLPKS